MKEQNELISYAADFVSYVISKTKGIERVILYGSVASGDYAENSDIDIFFDINDKKLERKIKKCLDDYYKTRKFQEWKLKGIENPISIIAGRLDSEEWEDLKRAIMNTGIILYGKYKEKADKTYQYIMLSFENIKPEKLRVAVHRKLFGFKAGKTRYPGLIEKASGIRVGKGIILVPVEKMKEIKDYLKNKKISPKVYDVWSDVKIS